MTKVILITAASLMSGNWVVPSDDQGGSFACLGEGQNGSGTSGSGAGGVAGAFALKNFLALVPGANLPMQIGSGNSGQDTWVSTSTTVKAQSGVNGGLASGSIGDVVHNGGQGGVAGLLSGGGGGGAAGPNGDGAAGTAGGTGVGGPGGQGDATHGGVGGAAGTNGSPGAEYSLTAGGSAGSGGGGGGATHNALAPAGFGGSFGAGGGGNNNLLTGAGAGAQGAVIHIYNPVSPASLAVAGQASLAAMGGSNQPAPVTIAGHGVLTASAKSTATASTAIPAHGSLTAIGRSTARAFQSTTGAGVLTASATAIVSAAFAIAAASSFSGTGASDAQARTTIAGQATLTANGTDLRRATVQIQGHGAVVASAKSTAAATFAMAGGAALTAHGTAIKPSSLAAAASATLTATGASKAAAATSIAASATLTATGASKAAATTSIAAHGSLAGSTNAIHASSLTVAGRATLQAPTAHTAAAALTTAGQGSLAGAGNVLKFAALAATGHGAFTAAGYSVTVRPATLTVQGAGAFATSPAGVAATTFTMAGGSSLAAPGQYAPNPSGQSIRESIDNQSQLKAALDSGLNTLSNDQTICFLKYVKVVLPLDGYVFWCRADLLSNSALLNANQYNRMAFGQSAAIVTGPNEICAKGSLHHSIVNRQDPDQAVAVNHMVFTSEVEIQDLNDVNPQMIYMACVDGELFAFSERKSFYKNAGIYHYAGDAVFPTMRSQIIDNIHGFDAQSVIVSNSLPIWLTLNQFFPVFPAYLVPDNTRPPFATIDVQSTTALQPIPRIDQRSSHYQLAQDHVKITIFGTRNSQALDYQDAVQAFMDPAVGNGLVMGLNNDPIVTDEHQWQTEINALAMKKTLTYDVSYYQERIRGVARQYILKCIPTLLI